MSFIQGVRASADVVATTDVTVLTLADAGINELFKERPGWLWFSPLARGNWRNGLVPPPPPSFCKERSRGASRLSRAVS